MIPSPTPLPNATSEAGKKTTHDPENTAPVADNSIPSHHHDDATPPTETFATSRPAGAPSNTRPASGVGLVSKSSSDNTRNVNRELTRESTHFVLPELTALTQGHQGSAVQVDSSADTQLVLVKAEPSSSTTPAPAAVVVPDSTPTGPANAGNSIPLNRPHSVYLSYARQAGVLDPFIVEASGDNIAVVPTFTSTWAGLAPEPTREAREEAVKLSPPRDPLTLHLNRMSGVHEWHTVFQRDMSFMYYVATERDDVKPDILRYKLLAADDKKSAQDAWSQFAEARNWWVIPNTVQCDRTFARDAYDCYYVDSMELLLNAPDESPVTSYPLFQYSVLDRWWNAFARRPDFLFERYCRETARVLLPYDSYETSHYTHAELKEVFAEVPLWMVDLIIPPGIPLPLAPIAYYFHSYLTGRQGEKKRLRAQKFLKLEYMALVIAFWWNEMAFGGRQFVLPPESIKKLAQVCSECPIVKGVPTTDILARMNGLRIRDSRFWNRFVVGAQSIPDCYYIYCEKGSGDYLPDAASGDIMYAEMKTRRLRLVLRQHRRIQRRRSSPLGLDLLVIDLVKIDGLDRYVKSQDWLRGDHISVRELLARLFHCLGREREQLTSMRSDFRKVQFENEGLRATIRAIDEEEERQRRDCNQRREEEVPPRSPSYSPRYTTTPPLPSPRFEQPNGRALPPPVARPDDSFHPGKRRYPNYQPVERPYGTQGGRIQRPRSNSWYGNSRGPAGPSSEFTGQRYIGRGANYGRNPYYEG